MRAAAACSLAIAISAPALRCHAAEGERAVTAPVTQKDLAERIKRDFDGRTDRPIASKRPARTQDGSWRSPDGHPVVDAGVIGWTRPREVDGAPLRAYWCEAEGRYWVHQESALGSTEFWFGPFEPAPPRKP